MKRAPQQVRIGYFGKIPTRSDFIKATDNLALVGLLDRWLAEVMNLLTLEPRWRLHYDALAPLHFAFVGTRSRRAIAGRLVASSDQSQRRFPFLAMGAVDVPDPAAFMPRCPLALRGLWLHLEGQLAGLMTHADPAPALQALAAVSVAVDAGGGEDEDADFAAFLDAHTLAGLEAMLAPGGADGGNVRRLMLAIGLLLQPVRSNAGERLDKSLALPLPRDPAQRFLVAAFWLQLIVPFLLADDVELALFFIEGGAVPLLVIGFNGADPHTLHAIVDPAAADEQQIGFTQMDWVDEHVADDAGARRLSACLEQGGLSLRAARALFHEVYQ